MSLNYISVEKIRPDKYEAGVLFSHYFCIAKAEKHHINEHA